MNRRLENSVEVLDRWGKYEEGGFIRVGGKEWQIAYVMAHHGSGCAWLVLRNRMADGLYEYDIDYEQGVKGE